MTEGNVSVVVKCVAVTHRENWMCVEVCGCGTDSTCEGAVLVQGDRQTDKCSGPHLHVDRIT